MGPRSRYLRPIRRRHRCTCPAGRRLASVIRHAATAASPAVGSIGTGRHLAMSYGDVTTSSSIVVRATAGGVQELIAIERSDAPNEFAFPLALPTGAVLVAADDGSAAIVDSSGHEVAAIAAPWAKDAAGRAVPTSYRLDGSTLIQVVEHEGATYPVVADPSFTWGIRRGLTRSRTKAARGQGRCTRSFSVWDAKRCDLTSNATMPGPRGPGIVVVVGSAPTVRSEVLRASRSD